MGMVETIDRDRYPNQGGYLGRRVRVCFRYDPENAVLGTVVRDDAEEPGRFIIQLDPEGEGVQRYVEAVECQWSPL